jgi:hypothetical protein
VTEDEAMQILIKKYGLVKASRLIHYALMLQGLGVQHFDSETSRAHRYKFIAAMREAGVYWDSIEFRGRWERWWLKTLKASRRRTA